MKRGIARFCVAAAAAACFASPALAADHRGVLPESARAAPGGRGVQVVVPQAELSSNINPSMVDVAMGGGLLGVVIDAKIDSDRERRALTEITPLRMALIDFDADQLAIDTTRGALATLPWFQPGAPDFARDPTMDAMAAELAASSTDQVAYFCYIYDTSPDFSAIRVAVAINIASKAGQTGTLESRVQPRNLVYVQTVSSVVRLSNPGSGADNAARWSANDGALAKAALKTGFAEVGTLIPRALTLTDDDVKRMGKGDHKTIGSYGGRLVEDGPGGTLMFNNLGLIHVQIIHE